MQKYLEKYPDEFINIMALEVFIGYDETVTLCNAALLSNKKIKVTQDPNRLDYLEYELI